TVDVGPAPGADHAQVTERVTRSHRPWTPRDSATVDGAVDLRDAASPHGPPTSGPASQPRRALDMLPLSYSAPKCISRRFVILGLSKRIMREPHGAASSTYLELHLPRSGHGARIARRP